MFQKTVNLYPAPAVEGDFASSNPRAAVLSPEGGFVAGANGATVARFAWVATDGVTVNNYGVAPKAPTGFIHREQQALITAYLAEKSNVVPVGFPVVLHNEGDFFVKVTGSAAAIGDSVYADYSNGEASPAIQTGATVTGAIGATFTATGSSTNLTVTSVTGLISIGDKISGTGVPANTTIVSQTSGTTGGAGVYVTSAATTASAATVTAFGTVLNVTAVSSGVLEVGDPISGTGIPTGAAIASQVSGAGGVGVYTITVAATAYAASTTVTAVGGVLTNFKFASAASVGELAKITTWG